VPDVSRVRSALATACQVNVPRQAGSQPVDRASPVVRGVLGDLFWHVDDPVFVCAAEGRVLAANPAAEAAFGQLPGGQLLGSPLSELLPVPALAGLAGSREALDVRTGPPTLATWRMRAWAMPGDRYAVLAHDVTRERALVAGVRGVAEMSRALIGQVPAPAPAVVRQRLADAAHELLSATFSAVLLLREGSLTEVDAFAYTAPRERFPDRLPRPVGLFAVALATRAPLRVDDVRGHLAGVGLPAQHPPVGPLLAVPLLAGDRVLGEIVVANQPGGRRFDPVDESVLSDLAAHAVAALRWSDSAAAAAGEAARRQELTDAARHDIRSPLAAARGYVQLLRSRYDRMIPEQRQQSWDGLAEALERVRGFVDLLLIDDRIAAEDVYLRWQQVDLAELISAVCADQALSAGRRHVTVAVDTEADAPTHCAADPQMLRSVLDNLVNNAIKFSPDGGTVQVTVRRSDGQVRFDVHDDGPGIPADDRDRLFERYTRATVAEQRGVPGLGLGLSIVRRLTEAHGGSVGLTSRPGEGTTFWVTFPVDPPAAPRPPGGSPLPGRRQGSRARQSGSR
jgi:signal transduction histidine kinase